MPNEISVSFTHPLRSVSLTGPAVLPLPPAPVMPSPETIRAEEERAAVRAVLASLAETALALRRQRQEWLGELQRAAVELGLAVASHLVHERIERGDFAVERLVRKLVGRLAASGPVTVYLHPDDLALLERRVEDEPLLAHAEVRLTSDSTVQRGNCRAESGDIGILWQLEDQLADLRERLLAETDEREAELCPPVRPSALAGVPG